MDSNDTRPPRVVADRCLSLDQQGDLRRYWSCRYVVAPFFSNCISFSVGFDYNFNAIENESNELFSAYKEMFEVAISQSRPIRTIFRIYAPFLSSLFVRKR